MVFGLIANQRIVVPGDFYVRDIQVRDPVILTGNSTVVMSYTGGTSTLTQKSPSASYSDNGIELADFWVTATIFP